MLVESSFGKKGGLGRADHAQAGQLIQEQCTALRIESNTSIHPATAGPEMDIHSPLVAYIMVLAIAIRAKTVIIPLHVRCPKNHSVRDCVEMNILEDEAKREVIP